MNNKLQPTLFDDAPEATFSSVAHPHNLFVDIVAMTSEEYKNAGENLFIRYSFASSQFGKILIASTEKGVCYLAFIDDEKIGLSGLKNKFSNAQFVHQADSTQQKALSIIKNETQDISKVKLHLKGTPFQLKVWECLLNIPAGQLVNYADISREIGRPKASRAVGGAIGSNSIAYLIPCHRVVRSDGNISGYRWGTDRKKAIIAWEQNIHF